MPDTDAQLTPDARTAAVRCYNVGLGDCFLLAFPRLDAAARPYYVVIDCGIARGTPDEAERMQAVVRDIRDATGGQVDLLVMTHEHYDHVIGFVHASAIWDEITVHQVFAPWTEIEGDPDADVVRMSAQRLNSATARAAQRIAGLKSSPIRHKLRFGNELLVAGNESFGISASEAIKEGWDTALSLGSDDEPVYCEPGDLFALDDTNVKAYILGPPRPKNREGKDVVSRRGTPLLRVLEAKREMYSYEDFGLLSDGSVTGIRRDDESEASFLVADPDEDFAISSSLLGFGPDGAEDFLEYSPFDPSMRIAWESAMESEFFEAHYSSDDDDWRRVDFDWLGPAADMALRAGGYTNNLSLVVAFELPRTRKVLLFVGDAQVGNWLSWYEIGHWWPIGHQLPGDVADIDDLLERVTFYKVGHHGSHNATIRDRGLEKMGKDGLTAYIPVSVGVAHQIMTYCPMPFYPLLLALQQKTSGAVFLGNGLPLEPLPDEDDRDELMSDVRYADEQLPAKVRDSDDGGNQTIEDAVPLWVEFTVADET